MYPDNSYSFNCRLRKDNCTLFDILLGLKARGFQASLLGLPLSTSRLTLRSYLTNAEGRSLQRRLMFPCALRYEARVPRGSGRRYAPCRASAHNDGICEFWDSKTF